MDTKRPGEAPCRYTVKVELWLDPDLPEDVWPDRSLLELAQRMRADGHRVLAKDGYLGEWIDVEMTVVAVDGLSVVERVIAMVGALTGHWLVRDVETLVRDPHPTLFEEGL